MLHSVLIGMVSGIGGTALMMLSQKALSFGPAPEGDPPPVRLASLIASSTFGIALKDRQKIPASMLLQFGFGVVAAELYVLAVATLPAIAAFMGIWLGLALWFGGDLLIAPLLGVAPPPDSVPSRELVGSLFTHLVYGCSTEMLRRLLQHI